MFSFYSAKVRSSKSLFSSYNPFLHIKADINEKCIHPGLESVVASLKSGLVEVSVRELCSLVRIAFCGCYIHHGLQCDLLVIC
jgi:SET domain-containing protein